MKTSPTKLPHVLLEDDGAVFSVADCLHDGSSGQDSRPDATQRTANDAGPHFRCQRHAYRTHTHIVLMVLIKNVSRTRRARTRFLRKAGNRVKPDGGPEPLGPKPQGQATFSDPTPEGARRPEGVMGCWATGDPTQSSATGSRGSIRLRLEVRAPCFCRLSFGGGRGGGRGIVGRALIVGTRMPRIATRTPPAPLKRTISSHITAGCAQRGWNFCGGALQTVVLAWRAGVYSSRVRFLFA